MIFKLHKNISLEDIKNHLKDSGFKNINYDKNKIVFSGRKITDVLFFTQLSTYNSIDTIEFEKKDEVIVVNIRNKKLKLITAVVLFLTALIFLKVYDFNFGYLSLFFVGGILIIIYYYSVWISIFRVKKDLEKII